MTLRTIALWAASFVALAGCSSSDAAATTTWAEADSTTTSRMPLHPPEVTRGVPFDRFVDQSFALLLARSPQTLTSLGISADFGENDDQLDDMSARFIAETQALELDILDALREYETEDLTSEDQLTYDVYEWYLTDKVSGHAFTFHEWPVHFFVNSYNANLVGFFNDVHPMQSRSDVESYLTRMAQVPEQVTQVIAHMETAVKMEIVPPRVIVDWTLDRLAQDLAGETNASDVSVVNMELFASFASRLAELTLEDEEELLDRAAEAIGNHFVPAWASLHDYMRGLREVADDTPGVWRLPEGDAYYAHLLRHHTTSDLSASDIHQLGLAEVERVNLELRSAFAELGYPTDQPVDDSLRTASADAGLITGGPEAVVATNNELIAEAERIFRPLFGLWPQAAVEVVADPRGGGYYRPGSVDGTRPGRYYANGSGTVPRLSLATINYHEVVPGHHLQIAIAQELDLPMVRRFSQFNAYTEGWGLYAERLAGEQGLYEDDPLGNVGRLQLELLRAARLVVDTGIHAERWTWEEAHDYMDQVIPGWGWEVERYMSLPGQATSYMVGMNQILALRDEIVRDGEADLAEFHDLILGSGSLPLSVMTEHVLSTR